MLDLNQKADPVSEIAETIRNLYMDQAVLLGIDAASLNALTRPAQVLESMVQHLAGQLAKEDLTAEDKAYLDQLPLHLTAVHYVAQNDLEHTALLQRAWIRLLAVHLALKNPERATDICYPTAESVTGGTARGVTEAELGGFMIEPAESRPMWEEALRMIPPMWTKDTFEWNGKYFKIPPRNVIPKPVQQPHPSDLCRRDDSRECVPARRNLRQRLDALFYTPEQIRDGRAMLDKLTPEFGRDPRSIEVVAAPVAAEPDVIKQYEDAGTDRIVVFVTPAAEQEMLAELEQIAAKIIRWRRQCHHFARSRASSNS